MKDKDAVTLKEVVEFIRGNIYGRVVDKKMHVHKLRIEIPLELWQSKLTEWGINGKWDSLIVEGQGEGGIVCCLCGAVAPRAYEFGGYYYCPLCFNGDKATSQTAEVRLTAVRLYSICKECAEKEKRDSELSR